METVEKLSHYFANCDIAESKDITVATVVEEMFPTTAKAHRIMNNYKHVTR